MPKGVTNTCIKVLLFVCVLLSVAGLSKTSVAAPTVVRGLLYTADSDGDSKGNFEIFRREIMSDGTSRDVQIVAGASTSWLNPKLSPDGNTVVVTRFDRLKDIKEVVTFPLASPTQVTVVVGTSKPPYNKYVYEDPSWSPDGHIIYKEIQQRQSGSSPYVGEIVEVDLSGGSRNIITENSVFANKECSVPSYSRNDGGKRIVFSCVVPDTTGGGSHEQIFVVDRNTKSYTQLTTSAEKHWYPTWYPSGNKLAYVLHDLGKDAELRLFDLDTNSDRKIAVPQESGIGPDTEFVDPSFSPTGRLAFSARWTSGTYRIFDLDPTLTTLSALVTPEKKDMFGVDYYASQSPTATPQTLTLIQDTSKSFTLGASGGQTPYTFSIVRAPMHGTTSGTLPSLTYRPTANYSGSDSLRFQVRDAAGETAQSDITFTITPANENSRTWKAVDIATASDNTSRLLWTTPGGQASVWTVSASGQSATAIGRAYGPYDGWTPVAIAVGGDGRSRLLWRHTSGAVSLWVVDAQGERLSLSPTYGPYPGWSARDIATGTDNSSRVLWTSTGGQMSQWVLNSACFQTRIAPTYGPYAGWSAQRLSLGSGGARVSWNSTSGQNSLWITDAAGVQQSIAPTQGPFGGWSALDIATAPNNTSRLLWHNAGQLSLWKTDGSGNRTALSPTYGPYAGWTPQALSVGGDGFMRVLWTHTSGAVSLWVLDIPGSPTISPTFGPYTVNGANGRTTQSRSKAPMTLGTPRAPRLPKAAKPSAPRPPQTSKPSAANS